MEGGGRGGAGEEPSLKRQSGVGKWTEQSQEEKRRGEGSRREVRRNEDSRERGEGRRGERGREEWRRWRIRADIHELGAGGKGGGGRGGVKGDGESLGGERKESERERYTGRQAGVVGYRQEEVQSGGTEGGREQGRNRKYMQAEVRAEPGEVQSGCGNCEGE